MKTNWKKYEDALECLDVHEDGSVWRKEHCWKSGNNWCIVRYEPYKELKQYIIQGYSCVHVRIQKLLTLKTHVLVALVHVPKPEGWNETWQVNHKNGVKTDCRAENLEWVTPSQNTIHAFITGLSKPHDNGNSKPVQMIDIRTGEVLTLFESSRDAERKTGINQSAISKCCRNLYGFKTAGGYCWAFGTS